MSKEIYVPGILQAIKNAREFLSKGDTKNADVVLEVLEEHFTKYLGGQ